MVSYCVYAVMVCKAVDWFERALGAVGLGTPVVESAAAPPASSLESVERPTTIAPAPVSNVVRLADHRAAA